MIDLHSHTNESDGSFSPEDLINEARRVGVHVLAITDHDTLAGYDQAVPLARDAAVALICGIELSTKLDGKSVHLLGYFPHGGELNGFRSWVRTMQVTRRERNISLAARLQELGLDITLEEAAARGRGMTGRPHFARIMVEKGYVRNMQQAFDEYLGESGKAYVDRHEAPLADAVEQIRNAGGIASLAHPVRLKQDVASLLPRLREMGLNAMEAHHSDHGPERTALYLSLAQRNGLLVTGGSDFHGPEVKPGIELGTGRSGNLSIPDDLVENLRAAAAPNKMLP
jgi:hypothetical protein